MMMSCILICVAIFVIVTLSSAMAMATPDALAGSPRYKLKYFDARGAAEVSRILFKIGGINFEDYRYPVTAKEGGGFETVEFSATKDSGDFAVNMDRVPVLEVDALAPFGQSRAIERYIAEKCDLMGDSAEERLAIDCIVENVRDIKDKWGKIRFLGGMGPSPEKEQAIEKWFNGGELAEWLLKLERSLPTSQQADDSIAIGSRISYADVSIWHLLRDYFSDALAAKTAERTAGCTRLSKISDRVAQMTAVKKWLIERPETVM